MVKMGTNVKKIFYLLIVTFIFFINLCVKGEDDWDFTDAQEVMDEYTDSGFDIKSTVNELQKGNTTGWLKGILWDIKNYFTLEIEYNKKAIAIIIFVAIGGAILSNFAAAFGSESVSETGSMISYIMFIGYLLAGFTTILDVAKNSVFAITSFLNALIPVYFLSVGLAGGGMSAIGFYETALIAITIISNILNKIMIPSVMIYVVLVVINSINSRDYFSKSADLIKTIIMWALKIMAGFVLGINVIQSMVMPSVDAIAGSTVEKIIRLIPGIGAGAGTVADLLIGSGTIIKNAIGTTIIIGMAVICIIPAVKIMVFILMYKVVDALLQPVTEKNISESLSGVIEGGKILLKITLYSVALFSVSIAIICIVTNIKI